MSYKVVFSNYKVEVFSQPSINSAHAAMEYGNKYHRKNGHVVEVIDLKTNEKTNFED